MSLPTVSRLFRSALRTPLVSVANVASKPAKNNISAGERVREGPAGLIDMMDDTAPSINFLKQRKHTANRGQSRTNPEAITPAKEQAIALTVMFMTILGPSSWILAHLEDYKKKQ